MIFVHFFAISGIVLMGLCFLGVTSHGTEHGQDVKRPMSAGLAVLFLAALAVRLSAAAMSKGFGSDTACFAAWADRIFQVGPGNFYSPDIFTDYPPGYMYVLWLLGAVKKLFGIEYYSVAHLILLKLPAITCDMACACLLFNAARKKCSHSQAFFLCAVYLFNPVIILNSSVWGQVDSVFTLAIIYMCLCIMRGRLYPAYIAFGIGVLIKPQTLIFAPVLLAGIIDRVFLKNRSPRGKLLLPDILHNLFQGLTVIGGMVILCLPFGLENVWNQYFNTVGSYPYAAVNASNFWGLWGLNWVSQDATFMGVPYRLFGTAAIAAAVFMVLFLSLRSRKDSEKYFFLGAFLILTIFVFSVRMHERYMYPGLLLLLFAYVYKPASLTFLCYGGFSVMHFYNTANVLFFYDPANYDRKAPIIVLVSLGMLACAGLLYYITYRFYRGAGEEQITCALDFFRPAPPRPSHKGLSLQKADTIWMLGITIVYSCFALYDLGDLHAPSTHYDMEQNQSIELDFGSEIPATLSYYIAPWQDRSFTFEAKRNSSDTWADLGDVTLGNVFTWQDLSLVAEASHLRFTLKDTQASLLEWTFLDKYGNVIVPVNASDYPALFDESLLHPEASSFRNSMYFDEIYHGRTAYEFIHGLTAYENTHPPLGKILIAAGVAIFGMNPFGWRIVGTIFGIAMVPLLYLFAKKLTDNTPLTALTCILFSFDFMHFTQTRIATIDVYITFFVILMYYFMYQYSCLSFYDSSLKKTWLPLGACGICMGLGIACKWTGIYAGAGLAVIFFCTLYRRYREFLYAKQNPSEETEGISHKAVLDSFGRNAKYTVLFCMVFFVAVPAVIYLLSYIPFRDYSDRGLISRLLYNQQTMFSYHSRLEATHYFSSPWYDWPIIRLPVWYYSRIVTQTADGGLREGISAFGNPAVWWTGIPASVYMLYLWVKKKDRTAAFLIVGYMAQYLPWFFVTRITFIYHYFPSVVFVVLMIGYSWTQWKMKLPQKSAFKPFFWTSAVLYGGIVVGLFLMFYPVLSGQPVEASYVDKYLRWINSWVLTAK